ncbi:MAG TPA: hypothetical protein PKE32_05320, partial [Miltoncostaeaceae bacterium]|nr:hypothetical protein [Miltoncostaeaceae bacterium]
MTRTTDSLPGPRAAGIHWDLSPLASDAEQAERRMSALLERCTAFAERYRGALADLDGPRLAAALAELSAIDNEL